MRRRDAFLVVLAWCVFILCGSALWYIADSGNWESAYAVLVPLLIVGVTGSAGGVLPSLLIGVSWLCAFVIGVFEAGYKTLTIPSTAPDHAKETVRLAWTAFLISLAASAWVVWYYPPWNHLDQKFEINFESDLAVFGFSLGVLLIGVMVICQWWVIPSAVRALIAFVKWYIRKIIEEQAAEAEVEKAAEELRRAEAEVRWPEAIGAIERGTTRPPGDWIDFSERVKDALLDLSGTEPKTREAWPATLPPLNADDARQLRARVDVTLGSLIVILNQSATGEIPAEERPRLKQLFRDLERDLVELGRKLRVDTAYAHLPAPQGHWAERYRQMKKAAALHPSETSQHDRSPSHN